MRVIYSNVEGCAIMAEGDEFRDYFSEDSFCMLLTVNYFFPFDYKHSVSMLEPFSEKLHSLNPLVPLMVS